MIPDLIIRSRRVIIGDAVRPAAIAVRGSVISAITEYAAVTQDCPVHDAGEAVIMPGLVDAHVHINEPGRTDWEGFASATRAAAAGGVTTLVEMPLNSIPSTTSVEAFRAKCASAKDQLMVDTGFWGGVVPGNAAELRAMFDAGVFGFKCFLVPSGVAEFPHVCEQDLRQALPVLASIGAPLLVHAEDPGPIERAAEIVHTLRATRYSTWLQSRPREAENEAISMLIRLAREFGVRVHIVHLSSSDALPCLRQAKQSGVRITAETCPHYLAFAADDIPDGSTQFKCAPPIRERGNRERLWTALGDGTIDLVANDHSPCPPEMKLAADGDFMRAWGGISSLQLSLPVMWTEARRRGYGFEQLVRWMCKAPAELAGLEHRKGSIAEGGDADLVIWNPEASFQVDPAQLHHRHKLTPYAGQTLSGVVQTTFVRGNKVYDGGDFCSAPIGQVLRRGEA